MSACEKALQIAKNSKMDECEAILSNRHVITIRITDSTISEIKENQEESLGIRIIDKKRITSVQTTDLQNIEKLFSQSLKLLSSINPKPFWKTLPAQSKYSKIEHTFDEKLAKISLKDAADIALAMLNCSLHTKVSKITGSLNIVYEKFLLTNSNGLNAQDNATYISGFINSDSEFGTEPVSGIGQDCCRTLEAFDAENIGRVASEMCVNSINPQKPDDENISVIFEPYSVGEILAFVASMNFNLKTYAEKRSCFTEKLGDRIATDSLTLTDNPHAVQGIGSKSFDDEGTPTQKNHLIYHGIFQNTFSDLYDARKEGMESTGNASRPASPMGRTSDPIPRSAPHNLEIQKGEQSQDEMIKETKKGLLIGRLWYTYAVNPIKGDFSCTARSGIRIIKNGEITSPGRSVRIVHNFPTLLQNISAIGNNSKNVIQWASLPSITPSIKAENIRITSI